MKQAAQVMLSKGKWDQTEQISSLLWHIQAVVLTDPLVSLCLYFFTYKMGL